MPVKVDIEKCTGCGDCTEVCPVEALKVVDEKCTVVPDECTDCEACVDECPEEALSMDE